MTIVVKTRGENLQHNMNIQTVKISTLSLDKFDKYEYLTGEEILSSDQSQTTQQTKFVYSPHKKMEIK